MEGSLSDRIQGDGFEFFTDYVSEDIATSFWDFLYSDRSAVRWTELSHRRLVHIGGTVDPILGMIPRPLPRELTPPCLDHELLLLGLLPSRPNHILINEYDTRFGIDPHKDGPAYEPHVVILSLGAPTVIRFAPCTGSGVIPKFLLDGSLVTDSECIAPERHLAPSEELVSILLPPRSLVKFSGRLFDSYLHTIVSAPFDKRPCALAPPIEDDMDGLYDDTTEGAPHSGTAHDGYAPPPLQSSHPWACRQPTTCTAVHDVIDTSVVNRDLCGVQVGDLVCRGSGSGPRVSFTYRVVKKVRQI